VRSSLFLWRPGDIVEMPDGFGVRVPGWLACRLWVLDCHEPSWFHGRYSISPPVVPQPEGETQ
jgi:hypothetical protein